MDEWAIDFAYNLISYDNNGTTLLHRGFAAAATSIYPILAIEIQKSFDSGQLGLITTTGREMNMLNIPNL